MSLLDRRTVNVLLTVLLFAAALAVAYIARAVLVVFCFSILFAYLIDPFVRFLQRHSLFFRNLRGPHVAEAYLALLILVALVVYTLAPGSLGSTGKLLRELPVLTFLAFRPLSLIGQQKDLWTIVNRNVSNVKQILRCKA